ncbi:molybdopterin cofactor-binding domain-containing protein [Maribellus sp. YY47]|uniref:xanthine dehydrogenase family protein molybdopterin-binding subunit n=1 Tax=Maribellus sp. YY47 TaxID=2929486 RepID=UPI002000A06D|nr:molybdopterin cofactor-binding domain-containing protein [Maribellus sp. YY47]MCK3685728.1 molybdopterin-dependent oxidoreductase [Maribellus sp. YY47]
MDEFNDYKDYLKSHSSFPGIKRRDFFRLMGGGIYIFFRVGSAMEIMAAEADQNRLPNDLNAFLQIHEDGTVTCFTGKIEMGQGVITGLAQMLADELDVAFEKVKMVMGDTDLCPWDMGTFGSLSTRAFGPYLRAAAAEARMVLLIQAAEVLGVPLEDLDVNEGVIFKRKDKKEKVTYSQLTEGKKIERFLTEKPEVKDYSEFRIMGQPRFRVDSVEKVTGKAKYSGDIRLPGMVYARILRPPSHASKLVSVDTSEAEKVEGVQIVKDGDLVAALHEDPEMADKARRLFKAEFVGDEKPVSNENVFAYLNENAPEGNVNINEGDLETGKKSSDNTFENEFHDGYVAHSPMEPHTAMAFLEDGKMTVWAGTQTPFPAKSNIARVLGFEEEKVRVKPPYLGGGFGGKSAHQQAVEAARLAKITGKPVMVDWNRQEEFFYDEFRPAAIVKINSGVDEKGKIVFWDYHVYYAGDRGAETMYNVPHQKRTVYGRGWRAPGIHPFPTGAWRGPGNSTNTFAREVQIDIMAAKAGIDPVEFRLKNLTDQRAIDVLTEVAKMADWKPAQSPSKRGYGVAIGSDAGTYVAHIAKVDVDAKTGEVKVMKVWCAQEMGYCVNPQGATIQMEGCINMGMGYALKEVVEFEGGKVKTSNFDTYEIPRFSWIPEIETKILDRNAPPQGGGEPAIVCMGAVINNAIYDLTGARLFEMAMTPQRILEALKNV